VVVVDVIVTVGERVVDVAIVVVVVVVERVVVPVPVPGLVQGPLIVIDHLIAPRLAVVVSIVVEAVEVTTTMMMIVVVLVVVVIVAVPQVPRRSSRLSSLPPRLRQRA
jgi:hypothetical protein